MNVRRMLGFVLALSLILASFMPALAAEMEYLTRGQTADLLLNAASHYNSELTRSDLIRGYEDGSAQEEAFISTVEALVMLSRAFGTWDQPSGHNARVSTAFDVHYSDVPSWAQSEVDNLITGGLLLTTSDGMLKPSDTFTFDAMKELIQRAWKLKGDNVKDSYYASVNKETLSALKIRPGELSAGGFSDLEYENIDRMTAMLDELLAEEQQPDSREKKIVDFYRSVADVNGRNSAGIEPIREYLETADTLETLADFIALRQKVLTETGASLLLGFGPGVDLKDSSRHDMYFEILGPNLPKDLYAVDAGPQKDAYLAYLAAQLELSGVSASEATQAAETYYNLEKLLAEKMLNPQDRSNVDLIYNVYTMEELQKLFPNLDLEALLSSDGYQLADKYIVTDPGLMQAFADILVNAKPEVLGILTRVSLISTFGGMLSDDFEAASDTFMQQFMGVEGRLTPEERASQTTQAIMADYLGELYVERYFSPEAKADVEAMVAEFIVVYKERINALDWMSATTKEMAVKKLDTMVVKIGYPDVWDDLLDQVEMAAPEDGGSFFGNICAYIKASHAESIEKQSEPVDKSEWGLNVYTVNAYYNATANEIVFPAGILQAPFYDLNASREENLGGIGFVIAHEITHSFDNNGAKFDEKGNASNWWSEEDYRTFEQRCAEVVEYYDGLEIVPGITNSGVLTLSENIADLGAVACVVEVASQLEDPDYAKLFENMATCFVNTGSYEYYQFLAQMDVHSANEIRINRAAQSSEAFYRAYDIKDGDGMYLAPEKRVKIW